MQRKPPISITEIKNAAKAKSEQGLLPPTPAPAKRKISNRFTQAHAISAFFGRGLNVYQASRETGHSIANLQEQIRQFGYREWERRIGRAA